MYYVRENIHAIYKINTAIVWCPLACGGTYTQTNDFLLTIDVPNMTFKSLARIEQHLSKNWKDYLWLLMEEAGRDKKG